MREIDCLILVLVLIMLLLLVSSAIPEDECVIVREWEECVAYAPDGICCIEKANKIVTITN